jgi:hypothetical protein
MKNKYYLKISNIQKLLLIKTLFLEKNHLQSPLTAINIFKILPFIDLRMQTHFLSHTFGR